MSIVSDVLVPICCFAGFIFLFWYCCCKAAVSKAYKRKIWNHFNSGGTVSIPSQAVPAPIIQKIVGTMQPAFGATNSQLFCPLSGHRCIYYQVEIEEHVNDEDSSVNWRTIKMVEESCPNVVLADNNAPQSQSIFVNFSQLNYADLTLESSCIHKCSGSSWGFGSQPPH